MKKLDDSKTLTINSLKRFLNEYKKVKLRPQERNTVVLKQEKPKKLTDKEFTEFAKKSQEILVRVRGVWPFDFFPNVATLDRQKFVVKRNVFWGISKLISSHHDDILDSHLNLGPYFGSVLVHMKYMTNEVETINWLTRSDAKRLHGMLQGLLTAKKSGMDLTPLSTSELKKRLLQMGGFI